MSGRISRRALLAALPASVAAPARAALGFDVLELPLPPARGLGRTVVAVVPRTAAKPESLPVLVLLHGLGETKNERAGLFAWLGPYGLARAWERLQAPPLRREKEPHVSEAEYDALGQSLAADPFQGLVVVCPFMPNPYAGGGAGPRLERFADLLEADVLPVVRERVPAASRAPAATGLAGVSLGGAVAIEVYTRKPRVFSALGTIQGAYGPSLAPVLARRVEEAGPPRAVYVATSSSDPYRAANDRLARELERRAIATRFSLRRGPHSQGWLIEIGSLETLLWHDRALRGRVETGRAGAG